MKQVHKYGVCMRYETTRQTSTAPGEGSSKTIMTHLVAKIYQRRVNGSSAVNPITSRLLMCLEEVNTTLRAPYGRNTPSARYHLSVCVTQPRISPCADRITISGRLEAGLPLFQYYPTPPVWLWSAHAVRATKSTPAPSTVWARLIVTPIINQRRSLIIERMLIAALASRHLHIWSWGPPR